MKLSTNFPVSSVYLTDDYAQQEGIHGRDYVSTRQEQINSVLNDFAKKIGKYKERVVGTIEGTTMPEARVFYVGRGLVSLFQNAGIILTHETHSELVELATELGLPKPKMIKLPETE